jgi:hypothetical protein
MCLGLALTIRGVVKGRSPSQLWLGYSFLMLAALAKENFLLVSLIIVPATVFRFGLREMGKRDWWTTGTALALGLLNLAIVAMKTEQYGAIYPQARRIESLGSFYHFAVDSQSTYTYLYAGVVFALVMLAASDRRNISRRAVLYCATLVVVLAALQIAFYAGVDFYAGRYLYPIALVPVFVWGAGAAWSRSINARPARVMATCFIAIALVFPLAQGINAARVSSENHVKLNAAFEKALVAAEAAAIKSRAEAVVLQPWEPLSDTERSLSLARYISTQTGIKVMTLPATHPSNAFSRQLAEMIQTWSTRGTARLDKYVPSERCLSIVFGANRPVCSASVPPPG